MPLALFTAQAACSLCSATHPFACLLHLVLVLPAPPLLPLGSLSQKLGWVMMFLYAIFVGLSLLLEYCLVLGDSDRCICMQKGINMF